MTPHPGDAKECTSIFLVKKDRPSCSAGDILHAPDCLFEGLIYPGAGRRQPGAAEALVRISSCLCHRHPGAARALYERSGLRSRNSIMCIGN